MTVEPKLPNRLILATVLIFALGLLGCGGATHSPTEDGTVQTGNLAVADTGEFEVIDTSWEQQGEVTEHDRLALGEPSKPDEDPKNSTEINADDVVAAYEKVIGDVHDRVSPSVVSIFVLSRVEISGSLPGSNYPFPFGQRPSEDGDPKREFYYRNGQGSGFVWDDQGHIVTNRHVVLDAERITVVFSDGTDAEAEVIGLDEPSDLAVIKVEQDAESLFPVTLGDSNAVRVGNMAITIGNPFGQDFSTTTGIISAIGRTIRSGDSHFSVPKVIQTDAPMNPGNSGGPLLDRKGRVIGIDAQIITRSGANTGIGFAIPINIAKQVVPVLISEGTFTYSWLGIRGTSIRQEVVELMDAPEGTLGAQIIALADNGPAQKAGLIGSSKTSQTEEGSIRYGGDVITGIDGTDIQSMNDLIVYLLENTRPGDTVAMSVIREGGDAISVLVTLEARPQALN